MKGKFGIILAGGFLVLTTIAAATGNFAVRFEQASRQTEQSRQAQPASTTIGIQRIVLTQGAATGFGEFQSRSNVIPPGTPFNIYFEPTNLATRFEGGNVRASMSVDILVRNANGETVATRDNAWQLPLAAAASAPAPLTRVYGDLMLNHLTFADGRYQIVLRIHDDFNGTFVDQVMDIELKSAQATPGPRLSQAAPAAPQR
jgi:hypothetical protein